MHSESTPKYWPNQSPAQFVERTTSVADRRVFKYTTGEEEARARFLRLALDSYNFLHTLPSERGDGIHPGYSFDPAHDPALPHLNKMAQYQPSLQKRWEKWKREYSELRARNPLLDLYEMIHGMGESYDSSGWKIGAEALIRDWVDKGDSSAPPPMCDPRLITPDFFNRLREIREIIGGWLYYVQEEGGEIKFMTDGEWRQLGEKRKETRNTEKAALDAKIGEMAKLRSQPGVQIIHVAPGLQVIQAVKEDKQK